MVTYDQIKAAQTNADGTPFTADQIASTAQAATVPVGARGAITPESLQPATQINLPQSSLNGSSFDGVVNGATETTKTLNDYIANSTPPTTSLDTQYQGILDNLASLTGNDAGKNQALAQEKINAGVPDLNKQLTDLNSQITVGNAAYAQLSAKEQSSITNAEATSKSAFDYAGSSAAIQRQFLAEKATKAAEIGMLAARAQAISGNISTALQIAQNAVDAKYSPIEDEIKVKQAQLDALTPLMNKEQKIQADALQKKYQDDQQKVADEKAKQNQIQNIMVEAAKSGASQDILSKIQNSQSIPEAITQAGESLGSEFQQKIKQQAFDNNIKLQQLMIDRAKLSIEQQKVTKDSGISEGDLIAYAQQFAATGNIPTGLPKGTFGAVSQVAASLPKAPGTIISSATGVVPPSSSFSSAQSDSLSATYHLINDVLPSLKDAFNNVTTNPGTGLFNALRLRTGDVTTYNTQRTQFLNTLLLAMSGKVVSEKELARYQSLIPSLSTIKKSNGVKQLDLLQKELTDKLNSYLANNQLDIVGYDPKNPTASNIGNAANFDK